VRAETNSGAGTQPAEQQPIPEMSAPAARGSSPPIDPRAPRVLAQSTYNELRTGGLTDTDIMAFAGELLSLVASGVRAETAAE
jgi:hypothetical protein